MSLRLLWGLSGFKRAVREGEGSFARVKEVLVMSSGKICGSALVQGDFEGCK